MKKNRVYLEIGSRRTFAGALDWPGWCRKGRDEASALQALLAYGPRYASVLRPTQLGFQVPTDVYAFEVVERLEGNATTDFGAPDLIPSDDAQPLDAEGVKRFQEILKACWHALDAAAEMAEGKTLQKGPRGGGRDVEGMVQHVLGAEKSYLRSLGGKVSGAESLAGTRQAILETLEAAARGEIAEFGPRGGKRWPARYFVRREAWHVLDHVWEMEDRVVEGG